MTVALVIAIPGSALVGTTAADTPRALDSPASRVAVRVEGSRPCSAHKAVKFYARRISEHRARMGAAELNRRAQPKGCPRYLAHVLQRKARAWRLRAEAWLKYHYAWASWLPDKWQRIGACETGYGRRPGNWRHSNSSYEGAFGFAKSSWDAFKYRADPKAGPYPADAWQATPRQQYEVALAIWRAYGFSGWGCRGA